ncbi:hypothetical protein P7H62_04415 [Vagococcus carniphilus]|uniref:hypothetical protein n=1 Tax=Vagococcus carniphilus TaxID=218144 RepID=UPI00288F20E0|nr:hypothetical protein [Vagococcus carniphilus]MDT2830948.1 hypothetical protein [Vagococcus carniphilus]MDT2838155.1 hypothetical protein [Vagococcus carniphilus]MDT2853684.1 hypothetical protein [Vagococcus carniphilus]
MGKKMVLLFIYLMTILSLVFCLFNEKSVNMINMGYGSLWLLPFTFLIVTIFLFTNIILKRKSFTSYLFIFLSGIRFVVQPFVSVITGQFESLSMYSSTRQSNEIAIALMCYELVTISLLITYLVFKDNFFTADNLLKKLNKEKKLEGNGFFYFIYIVFSFTIFLIFGRNSGIFSFIFLKVDELGVRVGDLTDFRSVATKQIVLAGLIFSFLLVVSFSAKKFKETNRKRYLLYSLIMAMINVSVIVGERRSIQVYTCISTLYLLYICFSKKSKLLMWIVGIGSVTILVMMSLYKFLNIFIIGSYSEALKNNTVDQNQWSMILSAYFGGVELLGTAIDMKAIGTYPLSNIFYDFLRSIFGISFFFKDKGTLTTEIFNTFVYGYKREAGQLIPSVGYGYLYMGFFLSPIFTGLNVLITYNLERILFKLKSLEMSYIVSFIFLRFGTSLYQVTPPLVSMATQYLCTVGLVFFISKFFGKRKEFGLNEKSIDC